MSTTNPALRLGCALLLLTTCALGAEPTRDPNQADAGGEAAAVRCERPQFSGVFPHLAAVADSYSECGIGAVVPWADRLWYLSYVSHKSGGGVGLYEITPDLEIHKRPESVVGTHAGRMIHRESNQLIIGPYIIDAKGNARVIEGLTAERVTAVMRHLTDPAGKVYVQAMEGGFYEVDVRTLASRRLFDLSKEELGIQGTAHFKGGYTAQGRVVVANNTYHDGDQRRGTGGGRLAEWDGETWNVIHRTAFCDVTTAGGIHGAPSDDAPLFAIGWDRASVLLAVLADGKWSTYRLPKGSQSYDHAWCTEWPRIREVAPGRLMIDMHGLFYTMSPDFAPGSAGGLVPLASHLRMTPDFCPWRDKLVLAGNELSSLNHRHRTGGQPQSNLWLGSLEAIGRWGKPAGWGGPWYQDEVKAGVPSDPFLIAGFTNRTLHLFQGPAPTRIPRCTDRFEIVELPETLAGLDYVTIERGSMEKPAPGYSFQVNKDVVVYLAVHDRGRTELPDGWRKTPMKIVWQHTGLYSDTIYQRSFPQGTVEIPGHDGHNELTHYGVPHLCFVRDASPRGDGPAIAGLPAGLGAKWGKQEKIAPPARAAFTLEVDERGTGEWVPYTTITLPASGYAYHVFPDDFRGTWIRVTADRDCTATAQLFFGSHFGSRSPGEPAGAPSPSFRSLSPVTEPRPRIHGGLVPFANRLWLISYVRDADGRAEGGALYELDEDVKFRKRAESLPGVFANRKMVAGLLSIGPHLISDDGRVRTFAALAGEHVVSSIRHPQPGKIYFLTGDGRLLEGDLETLEVTEAADLPAALGLEPQSLRFKAGHRVGDTLLVAASSPDGRTGCLAQRDGERWTVVDRAAFAEISNLGSMSEAVVATGWDRASAILKLRDRAGQWSTCRLPKASPAYDTAWTGEWPRIREVVTERMLMDVHGLMYEVSGLTYAWSIRPITAHGRAISDFCSWRGMLVLAGNDAAAEPNSNYVRGGADCGSWLGKTDDLWQLGKPVGIGGPWLQTPVRAREPSDPYLMADFEHKRVELSHDAAGGVAFTVEVDPTVQRKHWQPYKTITVPPGEKITHEFPAGFSAHWVRVGVDRDCTATARFIYD
ncbi:MAG TPA: hypothetical protein VMY37_02190 [Thermoguttaceae bacterium]|nr:hypothetical protein [Thermoguttaceae bacterium]